MSKKLTYQEAYQELQMLLAELEHGNIPIDELGQKAALAQNLVKLCTDALKKVEKDISQVVKK